MSPIPPLSYDVRCILGALAATGVPHMALVLVAWIYSAGLVLDRELIDGVEYFAGDQAVTDGLRSRRYLVYPYELKTDPILHDILGAAGFAHALALLLRVKPGGIIWSAHNDHTSNFTPPCHPTPTTSRLTGTCHTRLRVGRHTDRLASHFTDKPTTHLAMYQQVR
jgi:hypothetical protein